MMWARLAALPLVVEAYSLRRLEGEPMRGFEHITTEFVLRGLGEEGVGEDITPFAEHQDPLQAAGPYLDLAGEWTLESFCAHLQTVDQWAPKPSPWELALRWRNWAYESAALDLALRQAGLSLPAALELEPRPLTFVNSLGLGDPPSVDVVARRLEAYPSVGFKLDAEPTWTREIVDALAATGAVRTIDFKGQYGMEVEDVGALAAMYDHVLAVFGDDVLLEDPHDLPEIASRLEPHGARVSYDAPVIDVASIATLPLPARTINVKPSRIGSLRELFAIYEHCSADGVRMYGGGMGEMGQARGQVELLAALFHPDEPNDVAPSAFNDAEPPAGLPGSPLDPGTPPRGFRLT
jgi:hypothetical protein